MKKNEYLLSIVIPAYNAADTIVRALGFIEKHKSKIKIEVIVVNDGSTDNTKQVCEDYFKFLNNKWVRLEIINQKNAGHGSSINYGIKNAKGKYLRILDADDYFDEKNFDDYLDYLSRCDSDLVCSDYTEIGLNYKNRFYWFDDKYSFINNNYNDVIKKTSPYLLPCAAVKTDVISNTQILIDEKCCYDDQEYDLLIIHYCRTVSYYFGSVYNYVVDNEEQSISDSNLKKHVGDHRKVVEWLVRYYYNIDLPQEKKSFVFKKILVPLCHRQYYIIMKMVKSRSEFLLFDKFLKEYGELYNNEGVAGRRLKIHRMFKGLFI